MRKNTSEQDVFAAICALQNGALIVMPTDTVYGIAADPYNDLAIKKLYRAKERHKDKALPLLIADPSYAERYAYVCADAQKLISLFWPGALTLVLPLKEKKLNVFAKNQTIALRCPAHSFACRIIEQAGGGLAVSSANKSGENPATHSQTVVEGFANHPDIAMIFRGEQLEGGISTLIDMDRRLYLRAGKLSKITIEQKSGVSFKESAGFL